MIDARSVRFHVAVAVLVLLPAVCLAPGVFAAVPALTVDDIIALLEAGVGESVILKQADLSGTRLILTVDMLIQLKKAGASDKLLEALVSPPADGSPGRDSLPVPDEILQGDAGHAFRVFSEVDENGDAVVHVTNLDAMGKRIGGELERSSRPNIVQPSEQPTRPEESTREDDYRSYDDGDRGQVVVNVYPQDSGSGGAAVEEPYDPGYYDRYGRYATAYYGLGRPDHHFHTPTCGHLYQYYGRYTPYGYPVHHGRGHGGYYRPGIGVGVPYLGSIRTVPYSYSSAAVRNQKAFGRR